MTVNDQKLLTVVFDVDQATRISRLFKAAGFEVTKTRQGAMYTITGKEEALLFVRPYWKGPHTSMSFAEYLAQTLAQVIENRESI